MKKAKQFLSLMLVVVMVLGMMVFVPGTASAKSVNDYPDADSIEYKEAVDVLTALGVLTGDDNGTFNPKSNITREQAAKIITYILIGKTSADRLAPRASSFTDVDTSRWSNPYIEYCVEKGIIKGYGDGRFGPADPVTAVQMAKMLLMCIGYGAVGEYDNPDSWQLNTIVDGQKRRILTLDKDYTQSASREEVAQYTFNALTKSESFLVTYSELTKQYMPAGSTFTAVSESWLGQETFKLYAHYFEDDFGYGLRHWYVDRLTNRITGDYLADNLIAEFVVSGATNSAGTMFSTYAWGDQDDPVDVYVNGAYRQYLTSDFAKRGSMNGPLPAGAYAELIDSDWDDAVDKIVITYEVLGVVTKVDAFSGTVTVQVYKPGENVLSTVYTGINVFAEGYALDDYILITPWNGAITSEGTNANFQTVPMTLASGGHIVINPVFTSAPLAVEKPEIVEDILSSYTGTLNAPTGYPTMTLGGKSFGVAAGIGKAVAVPAQFGETTFMLDSYGSIIGFDAKASVTSTLDFLYVADAKITAAGSFDGSVAKISVVHTDGKVEVLDLATNSAGTIAYGVVNSATNTGFQYDLVNTSAKSGLRDASLGKSDIAGQWYSYTTTALGQVRLRSLPADTATNVAAAGYAVQLADSDTITSVKGSANIIVDGVSRRATSSTILNLVDNGVSKKYTGFANFPALDITASAAAGGTKVLVVYAPGANPTTSTIAAIYAINGGVDVIPRYGIILGMNRVVEGGYEYVVYVDGANETIISETDFSGIAVPAFSAGQIVVVGDDGELNSPSAENYITYGYVVSVDSGYVQIMDMTTFATPFYYYDDDCIYADTSIGWMSAMFSTTGESVKPTSATLRNNTVTVNMIVDPDDMTVYAVAYSISPNTVAASALTVSNLETALQVNQTFNVSAYLSDAAIRVDFSDGSFKYVSIFSEDITYNWGGYPIPASNGRISAGANTGGAAGDGVYNLTVSYQGLVVDVVSITVS